MAWVMRAVVTTPVARPAASAISKIVLHFVALRCRAVAYRHGLVDADHVVAGFHAGRHGDGRRRRIGNLRIMGVGLDQRRIGKRVHSGVVELAVDAALLALIDAAGRQRSRCPSRRRQRG